MSPEGKRGNIDQFKKAKDTVYCFARKKQDYDARKESSSDVNQKMLVTSEKCA